ncbi:MAG TPA: DNA-directed RNA polymerase subunit A' [Candidatus Thermoplasmatota archaeon]|nr:DNA-directed RNA polymerase subunit A' [Candidatus Thermoplasmatota archaeon]
MITNAPKKIGSIAFALLSPQEIRDMSATKIITADTYDDDGFPIDMGLMDPRLGVIEPGLRCKTCGRTVGDCPGHFGHIDLAMPIIHVGYTKIIKNLLRATCRSCGRILLTDDQIQGKRDSLRTWKEQGKDINEFVKEVVKDATRVGEPCPHCAEIQKKIDFEKPTTFREDQHKLTPVDVREWLEKIVDDDLELLGVNPTVARPEWMVLTVLPVPPVTMRPSITLDSGERSEDDLTHKLVDVLRINQRLQENRDAGAPQLIVEDLWELLQYHITTYMDNQTSGIPPARHRSGRPLKTLSQRLKGKEGRFRSNLSGKRVNFSARTVVSPDPNISINEVGVPIEAATELTVPLKVTPYNIEQAQVLVRNGPEKWPGVNYVIRNDGRRLKVTEMNCEEVAKRLEPGFVVERHLMDGDVVLFNRQPSLHRMSMMAHQVRVMPAKTFRVNLSVCPPYNADFDGDEMNMHVIQGEEARAEAKILMLVQEHILSPRFGGPIIGAIHDEITGGFLLTFRERLFTKSQALTIFAKIGQSKVRHPPKYKKGETIPNKDSIFPAEMRGKVAEQDLWTGKQLFSQVLPEDMKELKFNPEIKEPEMCVECGIPQKECPHEGLTVIQDGVLIHGPVDEKAIGAFKGEILNRIIRKYGNEGARKFIDDVTKLTIGALMVTGFTTSIQDEDIPEEAKRQIEEKLTGAKTRVDQLVEAYNQGLLEQMPGRSMEETLELKIMQELGQARDQAGKIAGRHLGLNNSAVIMAKSGARGSMLNLSQMAGCVGQQAVRGERITRGYTNRTLPHFRVGDLGAEAKGFVKSSYKSGLSPTEFFFHAMGGREGLVDTAVRTSRSGYMQRRLINALEDLKVDYDGTVRNTAGTIIQFTYGEDGVDPTRSLRGKAVNINEAIQEVLGIDLGPERTTRGKSTYDREDVELTRSMLDEMSEEGEADTDYGGE